MKKYLAILLALFLLSALTVTVYAAAPNVPVLIDDADLLTSDEEADLSETMWDLINRYDMGVFICTTDSLEGKTAAQYADDYYDSNYWDYEDGVLLLISTQTREWAISTSGKCIYVLSDYALDSMFYAMSDDLSVDDYNSAFSAYLNELDYWFRQYEDEQTVDFGDYLRIILVSLVIGAVVGGVAILIMRGQMKTAVPQRGAGSYLKEGSYNLTRRMDIFLYSRVSRTRRAQNNGSSTHRGSSGRSHGGRSGRF